jgi:hypothetical protein
MGRVNKVSVTALKPILSTRARFPQLRLAGAARSTYRAEMGQIPARLPSTVVSALLISSCAFGCHPREPAQHPTHENASAPPQPPSAFRSAPPTVIMNPVARLDFNRRAVERNQPIFWRSDENQDGMLQPRELAVTWNHAARTRAEFVVDDQRFTPRFLEIYQLIMQAQPATTGRDEREQRRQRAVLLELAQGRPTLIESDFSAAAAGAKALATHLERVAILIDRLYGEQLGTNRLEAKLVAGDAPSAALFFRNQGPFCAAPKTERDEDCNALPERPKPVFGLYPAALQADPKFCETLGKRKDSVALLGHFSTVVAGDAPNSFRAVSYPQAFPTQMSAVATELERAAADAPADEAALKTYLAAAARAFRDNDWEAANRAWVAMNAHNSKYYLRVGPDEVYYEPCATKGGFALAFARINPDSVAWQQRLEPIKQEMEIDLARLAGSPYHARHVAFKLPDFIDVVLNAGNNRMPIGAIGGQSLPNWGPVAESGGRAVIMTNIGTDEDSQRSISDLLKSMYCKATMAKAVVDPSAPIMGTVLHEATHNLGPATGYKVNGKTDGVIFGGPLASTLEELKAQTGALYFAHELLSRKLISEREAQISTLNSVGWVWAYIGEGMYDAQGRPKNYSQLAAIQFGSLQEAGALEWKPTEVAANGTDTGCLDVRFDRWGPAVTDLMRVVAQIKARGDKTAAERLKARWVDSEGDFKALRAIITERWLRRPKSSFVYSITGL